MKTINKIIIITVILITFCFEAYSQPHDLYGIWSKRAAFGSGGSATINTSTMDEDGNVYIAGSFTGTLNFSDDLCTPVIRTAPFTTASLFLIKYNQNGQYLWDVVFDPAAATTSGHVVKGLYYKSGKILFTAVSSCPVSVSLPLVVNATGVGAGNTKTITSPSTVDGYGSHCHQIYFQVVEATTGRLQASISELPSGAGDVYSARIEGSNVVAFHFGGASIYGSGANARSKIASFQLTGAGAAYGDTYTVTDLTIAYPNQPIAVTNHNGSRVRQNLTLPNGEQAFVHYAHDYTENTAYGNGIPSYYVMNYTNDYLTHNSTVLITDRATDANLPPKIAADAGSNVYVMTNFGHSKFWNTQNDISNSNFINDYMGSGQNFTTAAQHDKIALARVNHDLTFTNGAWAIQIGTTGTTGTDKVYGRDIKVEGNYIYIAGQFTGVNVPFGSGKTLSSDGSEFDGFYAVYDITDGSCEYAIKTGGTGAEDNTTLCIVPSSKGVLIGGTYNSPVFQSDPSERLYPLSNSGTTQQGFLTLCTTDPALQPSPYSSSYGDAPASYGTAVHHATPCVRLGGMDIGKLQAFPQYSSDANTALNDDGIVIPYSGEYVDLSSTDFNLSGSTLTAKVSVLNSTNDNAKLMGWIDFNQNGVFDGASEASAAITVNANTAQTTVNLQWADANAKLRNGVTYMRLRITTDNIDNTQPQGLFFNGEVEDYRLNFNVVNISKTAVSNNKYNTAHAMINDIITYTISVTNKVEGDITVFDPIPAGTEYVDNSADPSSGTLTNVNLYGTQNIPAIKWALGNKAANTVSTLKFKVRLTSYPADVDSVFNIAYAVMNSDTVPSTGNACDMAIITVDGPRANSDTVSTIRNTPITIDVLANDDYPPFCTPELSILTNSYNNIGVATVLSGKIVYTPDAGKSGIDSVLYQLKCNDGRTSTAKVYVIVSNPLSLQYVACPNATVTMGFDAISGITYRWYKQDGSTVSAAANSLTVTKSSAADIGTWWVEPRAGIFVFPRHRVDLEESQYCASSTAIGCSATGTLLYKEDFGGNDASDPLCSSTSLAPEFIDLFFCTNCDCVAPTYGYCFMKTLSPPHQSYVHLTSIGGGDDHTSMDDKTRGYFMTIDPAPNNMNYKLYSSKIKGLCTGANLSFTLWAVDIHQGNVNQYARPKIEMLIRDAFSGDTIVTSGIITLHRDNPAKSYLPWGQYGFNFTLPDGVDSILFTIINKEVDYMGNDWLLDDIEVRLCAPVVTTNITDNDTIVCAGNNLDIIGTYEADCVFGNDLAYQWEFRHVDSVNWKSLTPKNVTIDCAAANPADRTITETVSITSATKANEGYYRMLVSSPASIGSVNCRAASDSVYVYIVDKYVAPDLRIQICPSPPARTVQLSKYLDSTDYNRIEWEQVSPYPVITNSETGLIQNANLYKSSTYTFKYTLRSPEHSGCGESTARVYMRVLNNRVFGRTVDTIVICSALATSRSVNLNHISGLELGGDWEYPKNTNSTVTNNIKEFAAPSKYAGATVFNAQKAYAEADNSYNVSYKGVSGKAFDFVYTASSSSSCFNITKRIVLIVTL